MTKRASPTVLVEVPRGNWPVVDHLTTLPTPQAGNRLYRIAKVSETRVVLEALREEQVAILRLLAIRGGLADFWAAVAWAAALPWWRKAWARVRVWTRRAEG